MNKMEEQDESQCSHCGKSSVYCRKKSIEIFFQISYSIPKDLLPHHQPQKVNFLCRPCYHKLEELKKKSTLPASQHTVCCPGLEETRCKQIETELDGEFYVKENGVQVKTGENLGRVSLTIVLVEKDQKGIFRSKKCLQNFVPNRNKKRCTECFKENKRVIQRFKYHASR